MLALLFVLLPVTVWRYALRETVGCWLECRRIAVRLEQMPDAAVPSASNCAGGAELIRSGALLDTVRRMAEGPGVQVTAYEPVVTLEEQRAAVHTASLTLTGRFEGLLRVANRLERDLPQCRVRSLAWQTTSEPYTRRTQLTLRLYVQQIVIRE